MYFHLQYVSIFTLHRHETTNPTAKLTRKGVLHGIIRTQSRAVTPKCLHLCKPGCKPVNLACTIVEECCSDKPPLSLKNEEWRRLNTKFIVTFIIETKCLWNQFNLHRYNFKKTCWMRDVVSLPLVAWRDSQEENELKLGKHHLHTGYQQVPWLWLASETCPQPQDLMETTDSFKVINCFFILFFWQKENPKANYIADKESYNSQQMMTWCNLSKR